jgi:hypothetical protein
MSTDPQYQVEPEGFWTVCLMTGADGYSTASVAQHLGWKAIGSWGRDGWDLGSWPLVIVFHRQKDGRFDLATYVEGDIFAYSFPTQELRDSATDEIAFFYWEHEGESWVAGITSADQMPAYLRGPYSHERADRERDVGEAYLG